MNWKDIKTRRQLTQYLYGCLSSGEWGSVVLANFDMPRNWTDEPVNQIEVAAAIREARRMAGEGSSAEEKHRTSPPLANAETPPGDECPVCVSDAGCSHLLLAIHIGSQDEFAGVLLAQVELLDDRFAELFAQVAARQAICGDGLVRQATRAYYWGYGEIAGTSKLHAELDRDYVREYLMDVLDRAPNLFRTKLESSDDSCEYIWSESPDAVVALVRDRLQELQRLIDLPTKNNEWVPQDPDGH